MAKRKAPRTAFKKGRKKTGGRKKGTTNKFTRDIKEAILIAFNGAGGARWLERLAKSKEHKHIFAGLLGKAMPTEHTGKNGGPIEAHLVNLQAKLGSLSDTQLVQFKGMLEALGVGQIETGVDS